MAKALPRVKASRLQAPLSMLQSTKAGSIDRVLKLLAVMPMGLPSASRVVITVTPVGNLPRARRKSFGSNGMIASDSGQHGQETFVQPTVMVEDRLAQLARIPGYRFVIRVMVVATGEHFVTVAGRVKEIDGLTMSQPMTCRANID